MLKGSPPLTAAAYVVVLMYVRYFTFDANFQAPKGLVILDSLGAVNIPYM